MIEIKNNSEQIYYVGGEILAPSATGEFEDSVANDVKGLKGVEVVNSKPKQGRSTNNKPE